MMGDYGGMGGFGPGLGGIFMILFWGLIIAGIVVIVRWLTSSQQTEIPEKSALDILDERYAQGEIDRNEYESKRRDIER